MAEKGLVSKSALMAIADAIRAKTESTETMLPSEMAALIESISGVPEPLVEIEVVDHTLSADAASMAVPCGLSSRPTAYVAWCRDWITAPTASSASTKSVLVTGSHGYRVSGSYGNNSKLTAESRDIVAGKVTIGGSPNLKSGKWRIIFMRL